MLRFPCCLAFVGSLAAQQFAPSTARIPAEIPPGDWTLLALADCDGDGDQDVAANPATGSFSILRQGPGKTWTTIPVLPNVIAAATWIDFDGDGDLDVLVGGSNSFIGVPYGIVRNDGATFHWSPAPTGPLLGTATRCLAADLDGDLLPDAVIAVSTGVQVARNLGNNTIGTASIVTSQPDARPALFDRDGDGDLDLVVASPAGVRLFDNVGGIFAPVVTWAATGTDVVARDFNGDGRTDLALLNAGNVDILWNAPSGWLLAAAVVPPGSAVREVMAGDVDRDNDQDLIIRTVETVDWVQNDGSGTFTRQPGLTRGPQWLALTMALGDGASRGAVDVLAVFHDGSVRTLYGAPQPFMDPQALPRLPAQPGLLATGDVNGDGRLDVVAPLAGEVMIDTGRGRFERRTIVGAQPNCQAACLLDLDGDGDLDLILGCTTQAIPPVPPLQRLENDGLGNFTPVQNVATGLHAFKYRAGDVDGDGHIDLLAPYGNGQVIVYRNTGNGALVDIGGIPTLPSMEVGNDLVFEDLDGDGDRDLVCGQLLGTLPVFYNNGFGAFTQGAALPLSPGLYAYQFWARDLDGDGDLDVLVAEGTGLVWFRNLGANGWQRMNGAIPQGNGFSAVSLADVDEDGDVDIFSNGNPVRVLANDGSGTFTDVAGVSTLAAATATTWLDFDEDGDLDQLSLSGSLVERIVNRARAAESMHTVQPGGSVDVRFFVQPQAPDPQALVLAIASLSPGPSVVVPGVPGRLLLPLAASVPLAFVGVGTGSATTGFPVPPLVSLIGTEICVQGIVVTSAGFALTNVVDERILP